MARYQTRYQAIVQAILEFEDRFYNNHPKANLLKSNNQHNNYVSFEQIINKDNANLPTDMLGPLKHLRNIALNDGSPGGGIKINQEQAFLTALFPKVEEASVEELGQDLLNRLAKLP